MKCDKCGSIIEEKKEIKKESYKLLVPTKIHLLSTLKSVNSIKNPGIYYFNKGLEDLTRFYNEEKGCVECISIVPRIREWILGIFKKVVDQGYANPAGRKRFFNRKNWLDIINIFREAESLLDFVYSKGVNPLRVSSSNELCIWGNKVLIPFEFMVDTMYSKKEGRFYREMRFNELLVYYKTLLLIKNKGKDLKDFFNWLIENRYMYHIEILKGGEYKGHLYMKEAVVSGQVFSTDNVNEKIKILDKYFEFQ